MVYIHCYFISTLVYSSLLVGVNGIVAAVIVSARGCFGGKPDWCELLALVIVERLQSDMNGSNYNSLTQCWSLAKTYPLVYRWLEIIVVTIIVASGVDGNWTGGMWLLRFANHFKSTVLILLLLLKTKRIFLICRNNIFTI